MGKHKNIKGKITFENIGPGCWGIVESNGSIWRIVNMPEQLKYAGRTVKVKLEEVEEGASLFMWGTPAKLLRFETI